MPIIVTSGRSAGRPPEEKISQDAIRWRVGDHERVVEPLSRRTSACLFEKRGDRILIPLACAGGVQRNHAPRLEIGKLDVPSKRELDFGSAHDLEQDDLVTHARRSTQLYEQTLVVVIKVREDD